MWFACSKTGPPLIGILKRRKGVPQKRVVTLFSLTDSRFVAKSDLPMYGSIVSPWNNSKQSNGCLSQLPQALPLSAFTLALKREARVAPWLPSKTAQQGTHHKFPSTKVVPKHPPNGGWTHIHMKMASARVLVQSKTTTE